MQGVSYRAFTRRNALELGLTGKVRNLADGRVEAVGVGPRSALDQLHQRLLQGPPGSLVTALTMKEIAEIPFYEGFLIGEDGQHPWFA